MSRQVRPVQRERQTLELEKWLFPNSSCQLYKSSPFLSKSVTQTVIIIKFSQIILD